MKKAILFILIALVGLNITSFSQEQKKEKQVKILISTEYGDMTAVLYNGTPQHRDNFVRNIQDGWYENSPFHRVIKQFMIQGGMNADGRRDPGYTVPAEFVPEYFHKKGALAAARTNNPQKASSGSQFYIVEGKAVTDADLTNLETRSGVKYSDEQREIYKKVGGTPFLDQGYTVFGEVIEGLDVIDKIASVKTGQGDKPVKDVTMKITILEEK